ncbi:ABC transporter ATP-binding protein [Rubrimonas sp.]|uniref:ABC transporter ATP-binding protein n=1 Tax=Rubrimonas sp. TaxID=2036015 RepID=UPI002FDC8955
MNVAALTRETVTRRASAVLSVQGLSVDFHLRTHILHAVRDVSFELRRGRTLALVGESGSGKSVTARAIMRLIDPTARMTAGRILLDVEGRTVDLAAMPPTGRAIRAIRGRRIGLVFQEPMSSLSPVHSIGSQIAEALRLHRGLDRRAAKAATVDLLRQVEIADPERMAARYPFEYSGGMRQRAMIAMALACEPDVLIADEPTTALDVTTQAEILDLILRLQQARGMAMLLITHDLGIVAEVAEDVAVMRYGRIVEAGPATDVLVRPRTPYARRLLDATTRLEAPRPRAAPSPDAPAILSVRGLGKTFGRAVRAVEDVSFDLRDGENLGIVGESGSGKTTLGRLILRVVEPTEGVVTWRSQPGREADVRRMDRRALADFRRQVRMVFQDPYASLNPRMTIGQIVGEPLWVAGRARGAALTSRVEELLDLVGLDPAARERYPHAFSGGQRQRVVIARALALDPRVIVADEATSALDVSIRAQILDLMLSLQQRLSLSYLFISHDIAVVRYFCDRVIVMRRGRVVETGTAEQVCRDPREPYTRALISAVPSPDPRARRMANRTRFAG